MAPRSRCGYRAPRRRSQARHDRNRGAAAHSVTGPWPHGDRFVVGFQYDVTNRPSGKRMKMNEVGLYTIRGGKIVREEFFYDMGG